MINIGIGVGWAKALYSVANNVIANFKARVLSYPNSIFEAGPCLDATLEKLNAIGLLDNASLVITPNAYNEGILYDVIPNTTLGDMDVVRATTATRVNSAGLIEVVPRNLLTYSNDFTNVAWSKDRVTISANSIISPDGTLNASKLNDTLQGNNAYRLFNSLTLLSQSYTQTFYAKAAEYNWVYVRIGNAQRAWFNISNGTLGTINSGLSGSISSVGNGWYKITTTITTAPAGGGFALIGLTNADNVESYTPTTGGQGIYIYGAQLDQGSTATEYFPTTTRLNIPRIDYTNGSCPSLLVEPQRTNLALRSEEFENVSWSKSVGVTVGANSIISPSGIQNADKFIENNVTGDKWLYFTPTVTTGTNYTYSVYAKKGERDFIYINAYSNQNNITWFNLNTGTIGTSSGVSTITNIGNGWYRCSVTITVLSGIQFFLLGVSNANNVTSYFGNGTSGIYVWGAQLELGSYPTSYIPTVASSVTRNADVISKTGISSLIGQTEGTIFINVIGTKDMMPTTKFIIQIAGSKNIGITFFSTVINVISGLIDLSYSFTSNQIYKIALCYSDSGNFRMYVNGVKTNEVNTYVSGTFNSLGIGCRASGDIPANTSINLVQLYKTALTNTEAISLTTL